ncbi:MAG: polysaccharide biosynthesis tyrosine autokinase, partial [Planctomycetota bacterium]
WGFHPDSFLARVNAAPIPNTYLAKLTFRAGDPGIAVFLVNLYSELYRDVSREEREETLGKELAFRDAQRSLAAKRLEEAQEELKVFRAEHPDHPELALEEPVNLAQQQVGSLAGKLEELATDRILRRGVEEDLRKVLSSRGVVVVVPEDGPLSLRLAEDGGGDIERFLAEDLAILGLSVVESSASVALLRSRLRGMVEESIRLRAELTEKHEQVKRLRERMAEATRELGAEVGAVVLRYLETRRREERVLDELSSRLREKREEARKLNALYAGLRDLREKVASLKREEETLEREYGTLLQLQTMKEQQESGGPLMIQNIALERRARLVDARQVQPKTMIITLLTVLAALFLSFGSALLLEFMDDTVKSKEDFERLVKLPDIALIPRISDKEFTSTETAVSQKPRSGVAEAFRTLRTGVLFSRRDEEIKSCLVTSAGPGEGKTTIAANLAITMAQAGRGPVLLIDADLRKSRIHSSLGLENKVGLTNCLVGSESLAECVRATEIENLFVLTSGPTPPNPAELLGGLRTGEILREAQESYAKVILDTPPLVPVTDTCLLSTQVDCVFLVISVGRTSWRLIQQGKEALGAVGVNAAGAILNNMRSHQRSYGYEPYYHW